MTEINRMYGEATSIYIPQLKAGSDDFAATGDWTPATGDVKISKDGGAVANIGTLPVVIASMSAWKFALSAAEMTCASAIITIIDSATKAVQDDAILINTYGHPLSQHSGWIAGGITYGLIDNSGFTATTTQFETDTSGFSASDDAYNRMLCIWVTGANAGIHRLITDFTGSSSHFTLDVPLPNTPADNDVFFVGGYIPA